MGLWMCGLVDVWRSAKATAQDAIGFGIVAFVREHGRDAGHDGESGEEQALEDEGIVDVGRRRRARDGDAVAGDRAPVIARR